MSSELRASEMRMSDLVSELGQAEEELHRTRMERDDLRRVVGGLDSERDGMQVCGGRCSFKAPALQCTVLYC